MNPKTELLWGLGVDPKTINKKTMTHPQRPLAGPGHACRQLLVLAAFVRVPLPEKTPPWGCYRGLNT